VLRTKSQEEPSEQQEKNIDSTYEICPEMSQSMLEEEQFIQNLVAKDGYFLKKPLKQGFQESEIDEFSGDFDNSRRLKEQKGPEYRVIDKYVKSKKQYWKERERRKRVWELSGQGLTYKQIAEKLGVSEKTVQRDMKKIRPYYFRLSRNYLSKLKQEHMKEFNAKLEGKTLHQQFKLLSEAIAEQEKLWQTREYRRHSQIILLDLTQLDKYGIPKLSFSPKGHQTLAYPYKVRVHVRGNFEGKEFIADIGGFDITQRTGSWW